MTKKRNPEEVLNEWLERDLTAAAEAGELPPAFEAEEALQRISDVLDSGHRPVLSGESGVGKTALVYELVRRARDGRGPQALRGRRVLQLSIRNRAAALAKPEQLRPELQKLVEALLEQQDQVAVFFRDLHLAWDYDLEPQFQLLGFRFRGPVLAEGDAMQLRMMFESMPELEQHYLLCHVDEPTLETAERLLYVWAEHREERLGVSYEPSALAATLELTHRFLAKDRLPRKAVDLLSQLASLSDGAAPVSARDVIALFCRNYNVPQVLVDPDAPFDLEEVRELFLSRVLGQDEAVRAVVQLIGLVKAGLSDMRRPFGALLFVGPTGVGKTHLAQLLAEFLFGSRDRLLRLNMADYQHERDAMVLFGDPDGHLLQQRRGVLHQRLLGHPFAVVLLDEFEKAHRIVHDRFLQLMDEGKFINGAGETVPCRSVILIATSNTGAEIYRQHAVGFAAPSDLGALDRELDRRLARKFRFEFLNRLDQVVHFHPLGRHHIRTIAERELEQLQTRVGLKNRRLSLEVDDAVLDWLVAHGYDPHFGARFLRRIIERNVTTSLAETIVREAPPEGGTLALAVRANAITSSVVMEDEGDGARRSTVRLPAGRQEKVRSLDRPHLLAEIDALLTRAVEPMRKLDEKRRQASALLSELNASGFWDRPAEGREVLERYRELDVSIQVEGRFAEALERLEALRRREDESPVELETLGNGLERGAQALRQWEDRMAEEGPSAIWLLIRNADPLQPAPRWLEQLVAMELAWCAELHLTASVVAYGTAGDDLSRVALEVEGPGASAYLEMEQGVHRFTRKTRQDWRAQILVVHKGPPPTGTGPEIAVHRSSVGRFGVNSSAAGRIARAERGQVVEFFGVDAEALKHLLADLEPIVTVGVDALPTARIYGVSGAGARDPRTGVVVPRIKDVLGGHLDPFLDGWRSRAVEAQ